MTKRVLAWALLLLLGITLTGCSDNPDDGKTGPVGDPNAVLLRPDRFPSLFEGLVYEAWVVNLDDDSNWVEKKSLGKFFWDEYDYRFLKPDGSQEIIDSVFSLGQNASVYDWEMLAITLEEYPNDDNPAEPSATVAAQGAIIRDIVTTMRFPVNFDGVPTGFFVVATFSDGHWRQVGEADAAGERYGIWFLKIDDVAGGQPWDELYDLGLTLPVLPDTGYLYEGWVALEGGDTVSTGKFYYSDYIDYDNSHCKLRAIPNFPGEDFIENKPEWIEEDEWPLVITRGGTAFVTVEPNPDNDLRRPSNLIVLRGNLPKREGTNYAQVRTGNFPIGSVTGITFPKIEVGFLKR